MTAGPSPSSRRRAPAWRRGPSPGSARPGTPRGARGRRSSPRTTASASRCFSPPDRSRGLRAANASPPARPRQRRRREPRRRPSRGPDSRSGFWSSRATRPAALTPPRVGVIRPGGVAQQRGLARAVAPHQRHPLPRGHAEGDVAQDRRAVAQFVPNAVKRQRHRAPPHAIGAALATKWRRPGGLEVPVGLGQQTGAAQRGAGALDPGRRRLSHRVQQLGAGRLERRGPRARPRPGTPRATRRRRSHRPPARPRDRRRPGSAPGDARRARWSRRSPRWPTQEPDQLVAGHRIELRGRLVQHDHGGPAGQRRPQRHPLQLAARQLGGGAVQELVDGERQRRLLHPARHLGGRWPRFSSPKASSARTVPVTTCVSGS